MPDGASTDGGQIGLVLLRLWASLLSGSSFRLLIVLVVEGPSRPHRVCRTGLAFGKPMGWGLLQEMGPALSSIWQERYGV